MSMLDPRFGPDDENLTDAGRRLLAAAAAGTLLDLRAGSAKRDDLARAKTWGADRRIHAELLIELLTGIRRPGGRSPRAVKLRGARIAGSLNLEAATCICPLLLQDCSIEEPVNLDQATAPAIRFPGCHLPALTAVQLRTTGDLVLNTVVVADGEICLIGARIGGELSLNGARLSNPGGLALSAGGLAVEQGMFCRGEFTANGEVCLIGARIGGQLRMEWARLACTGGLALNADRLTVEQNMDCSILTANGEVRLLGARIGGQLNLAGAALVNPGGPALYADRLTVEESMFCRDSFTAVGEVRMIGARIGGQLSLNRATLSNPNGIALNLQDANVSDVFLALQKRPDGAVDLTNARVGIYHDDPASWPAVLFLEGFTYDSLSNEIVSTRNLWPEKVSISTRDRLRWLTLHPSGYSPQLYDQLAGAYRRTGDEQAARKVAIAKQQRRRRRYSPLSWLWYATVGYGYRPWLAGAWVIALVVVGTVVFGHAYPAHMIATSPHSPSFHAAAYTLDLLVPVIGLGQRSGWQPQGTAYLYWSWAFTGVGWVLTAAVGAGLTGMLKRD